MWVMIIIKILLLMFAKHLYMPIMGAMFITQTTQGLKRKIQSKYIITNTKKVAI